MGRARFARSLGRRAAEYDRQNRFFAEVCAPGCGVYRCGNLALEGARRRKSLVLGGKTIGEHALVQDKIATAAIELDEFAPTSNAWRKIGRTASTTVRCGRPSSSPPKRMRSKARVAWSIALNIEGAGSLARSNELERLYRDVRAGDFIRRAPTPRAKSSPGLT